MRARIATVMAAVWVAGIDRAPVHAAGCGRRRFSAASDIIVERNGGHRGGSGPAGLSIGSIDDFSVTKCTECRATVW